MRSALDAFIASGFAIIMAIFGALTRLAHEHAQGVKPISWVRVLLMLPSAVMFGVSGAALAIWLGNYFSMPVETWVITGGAIGGPLAYIGPQYIELAASAALKRWGPKAKEPVDGD